jgi:hypothetical protein
MLWLAKRISQFYEFGLNISLMSIVAWAALLVDFSSKLNCASK